jgi:myo-inositol 2-dehydrogenase/D-chiro-inositol 1-dehydrogenase
MRNDSAWWTILKRMEDVRVAVVGVGGMGSFHARTLARLTHVELVAVADPIVDNANRLAAELGCLADADPYRVAGDGGLDGVVIASPDHTHADLAVTALEAGLWVLCEKPLATTLADAWRVVDAERAIGERRVQLGFMREYDPAHVQLMATLAELGPIDAIRAVHRNTNATRRPIAQIVGQSMVHDIHSVRFITGAEIRSVHAFGAGAADGSFRHTLAVCQLDSGAHAMVEFDDAGFAYDVSVEVLAQHGDVLTGPPTRAVKRSQGNTEIHLGNDWFAWFGDAYRAQDRAWTDSISERVATGPSTWDGLVAHAVVEAVLASLATGTTVEVEPLERPGIY